MDLVFEVIWRNPGYPLGFRFEVVWKECRGPLLSGFLKQFEKISNIFLFEVVWKNLGDSSGWSNLKESRDFCFWRSLKESRESPVDLLFEIIWMNLEDPLGFIFEEVWKNLGAYFPSSWLEESNSLSSLSPHRILIQIFLIQ